jgi:Cell division septal protein
MTPDVEETTDVDPTPDAAPAKPDIDLTADAQPVPRLPRAIERPALDRAVHRRWRIPAIAFMVVVVLVAAGVTLTRTSLFGARTIHVRGAAHLTRSDILRIAGIRSGTNVFTFDAVAAERRLEGDPWIAHATVTKHLPSTVSIDIRERVAVAVAESGGILRVVADDGVLLEAALPRLAIGLPHIASAEVGAPEPTTEGIRSAAFAVAAMTPVLRREVDVVSILADGQLRVDLRSGAQVAYGPAVDLVEKAQALGALLAYAAEQGMTLSAADVRVPSAPTVQLAVGAANTP